MAVLDVLVYPDPRLKQVSAVVERFDAELADFIENLAETMRSGPAAVGIAAPQVGNPQRIIIVDASTAKAGTRHGCLVLINPRITDREGSVIGREGCLSVPDYTGNVERAERIAVEACDAAGGALRYEMEGFEARVVQHEIDHLDGRLFIDRIVSHRDLFRRKVYR